MGHDEEEISKDESLSISLSKEASEASEELFIPEIMENKKEDIPPYDTQPSGKMTCEIGDIFTKKVRR